MAKAIERMAYKCAFNHCQLYKTYFHISPCPKKYFGKYTKAVNPVVLSHSEYGKSSKDLEPIIIMHGLMGSKANWNSIAKSLSIKTKRMIFCVDARNHGHSPHSSDMTYHDMAADLEKFITDQNSAPAVVIGHSMGGRAAMLLALTKPSVVNRLVVVDISPLHSSPSLGTMGSYFKALREVNVSPGISLSDARKIADEQLASVIEDPRIRQFLLMNLDNTKSSNNSIWRVNLQAFEENFRKEIAEFPLPDDQPTFPRPTLFIAGGNSDYVRKEDIPGIKQLFPMAQFKFVDDAGHWVHADQPHKFIDLVVSFLNS